MEEQKLSPEGEKARADLSNAIFQAYSDTGRLSSSKVCEAVSEYESYMHFFDGESPANGSK